MFADLALADPSVDRSRTRREDQQHSRTVSPAQKGSLPAAVIDDPARIWHAIQEQLRRAVPSATYDIWLAPLRLGEIHADGDGDEVVIDVPRELRAWVAERFARVLQTCVAAVLGPEATVELRCTDTPPPPTTGARAARTRFVAGPGPERATQQGRATQRGRDGHDESAPTGGEIDAGLNPKFTFDQFVLGPTNRFAHGASLAVAELPGQAYNPLFIYGPPGVGKSHLLHSIGNYVRSYGNGLAVRCTTVETFTNEFVEALRTSGIERFKARYRRVDVLLVDDVQFLAQKARTEEEFFHTFNALHASGSQLVLTSDRVPRDLDGVHERLRERFEAGLVTDIQPPDLATRLTVLRKRVAHDGVELRDDAVLDLIAARVTANIRALEGALIRTVAFASLTGRPLDVALAAEVLDDLYPQPPGPRTPGVTSGAGASQAPPPALRPALTIERIQEITARAFGLEREDLLSTRRTATVAWARQLAMYLVREHTDTTLPAIGRSFGGRNHTTVLHACRRAAERLAGDPEASDVVHRLLAELGVGSAHRGADRGT